MFSKNCCYNNPVRITVRKDCRVGWQSSANNNNKLSPQQQVYFNKTVETHATLQMKSLSIPFFEEQEDLELYKRQIQTAL